MEELSGKVRKKSKTGPLKSTPGFLKCMRSVYLYFKEEKEKGALNIPINSFIERTAVACGVGRGTLYNYAKKGLFDDHPSLLLPKQKKKKGKKKLKANGTEESQRDLIKKNKKKLISSSSPGSSHLNSNHLMNKKKPVQPVTVLKTAKNAMIQTEQPLVANTITMQATNDTSNTDNNGFSHFMITRGDDMKPAQIQVLQQTKVRETHVISGPWSTSPPLKRDGIDYFTKNNIWQTVYSVHEPQSLSTEIQAARLSSCQQHTTDHLTDL